MTLARPTATLEVGGGAPAAALVAGALTPAQAALRCLRVDLSVDEAHDRVELHLSRMSPLIDAQPGDRLAVGLGDGDDVEEVLAAEVAGLDAGPWGAVLTAYAPSRRLASTFVGRAYVDSTVADVVGDLLAAGDVDAGDVDAPLQLPAFHVDPRRSAWATLHALARRTGRQVTSTADGAVSFTAIAGAGGGGGGPLAASAAGLRGGSSSALREGAELLAFAAGARTAAPAAQVVTPSGATGARWHLLAAEPDPGTDPVVVDLALRTREGADAATAALAAAAARRARRATITVPGRGDLRAGATVTARDEVFRVLRARHVLDAEAGYLCELLLEGDR